jgi:adenine-specific DNA-methyltransferase
MDKLKMHSPDLTADNIERLAELFPGCVVESRNDAGELAVRTKSRRTTCSAW